jgi:RNA polymerase primary sigma factor
MNLRAHIEGIPPITAEEEPGLVAAARAGGSAARTKITTAYLHLVWAAVAAEATEDEMEEALAEGSCALLKALDRFDPAQGSRFGSYAKTYVRREVRTWLRGKRHIRRVGSGRVERRTFESAPETLSMDEDLTEHESGNGLQRHDVIADSDAVDPEEACIRRDDARRVRAAVDQLPASERRAVSDLYLQPGGVALLRDAAARRGVSPQYVAQTEARALDKLRRALKPAA